jgi:hypothetical protein
VEDTYQKGGGVVLDRDRLSYGLESVCDLEEELCGFMKVLRSGGQGRGVVAPIEGEFRRQSICEEGM